MSAHLSGALAAGRWRRRQHRRPIPPLVMLLGTCGWMATVGNIALWKQLAALADLSTGSEALLGLGLAVFVLGILALFVALLAWPWTFKPTLFLLLATAAVSAHFSLSFGTLMDPSMMTNLLQTDPGEAAELATPALAGHVLLLAGLPAAWIAWQPVRFGSAGRTLRQNVKVAVLGFTSAMLAVLVCFQPLASTMRNHRQLRYLINPLNVVYSLGSAGFSGPAHPKLVLPIGEDARVTKRFEGLQPPLMVLVVGETARSGNFGINGYGRATTPVLAGEDVMSFRNAWSCGTSTAASLPCMFSRMSRTAFVDRDHEEQGLLDVLQRAGYGVMWVDNQGGCKGVCDRVVSSQVDPEATPSVCSAGECLDEALLVGLDERIMALPAAQREKGVVIVLHQMGSHGPAYFRRSSRATKRFLPECTSAQLQDCSRSELVNAYDNSIAYTDRVLGDTIRWLKGKEGRWRPAMLYLSDHGESLGESNLYLHGIPYALAPDVQKRVPWISWMSAAFRQGTALDWHCLAGQADTKVLHDHLFHSVLGLMNVTTSVYDPTLDAYAPCRH